LDDVQFRGTTPQTIRPGEYFPVKIMMYREDDHQRANRESAAVADKTTSASSSIFPSGILVGEVEAVEREAEGATAPLAQITPAGNASLDRELFILVRPDEKEGK
jgi:hypothetical protein